MVRRERKPGFLGCQSEGWAPSKLLSWVVKVAQSLISEVCEQHDIPASVPRNTNLVAQMPGIFLFLINSKSYHECSDIKTLSSTEVCSIGNIPPKLRSLISRLTCHQCGLSFQSAACPRPPAFGNTRPPSLLCLPQHHPLRNKS